MPLRTLLAFMLVMAIAPPAWAQSRGIFDLPSGRAQRAVVTIGENAPPEPLPETAMERLMAGIIADLNGRELNELRASAGPNPRTGDAAGAERWCVIHLSNARDAKRVAVYRTADGFVAVALNDEPGAPPLRVELRRDAFAELYHSWPMYRGGFTPDSVSDPIGPVFRLEEGLIPGRFTLDKETVGERILGGGRASDEVVVRDLSLEKLNIRLPRGYDPRKRAGVLVWVDAGPKGEPPALFHRILDDMNLIAVGAADSGNQRGLYSRIQLALDGVATVSHRYHVDPARIYISGISGGGRVASIAQVCFPDVFTGCVPIVGMSCYENVPNGLGQYYRAAFRKPVSAIFKLSRERRIAPMSGRKDANLVEMQHATEIMRRDGIPMKFFEDPQMGHEMPKEADLRAAMEWIDEPAMAARAKAEGEAVKAFETYSKRAGDRPPQNQAERTMLARVLEAAPWGETAWRAWNLMEAAANAEAGAAR